MQKKDSFSKHLKYNKTKIVIFRKIWKIYILYNEFGSNGRLFDGFNENVGNYIN